MRGFLLAAIVICVTVATPVMAQTGRGGYANVGVSATVIDDGTRAALTAGAGYQLSPVMALGVELTVVPSLKPESPQVPPPPTTLVLLLPTITFDQGSGHATIFTTNVRLRVPAGHRLQPFIVAGGGVATVSDQLRETIAFSLNPSFSVPGGGVVPPQVIPAPTTETVSRTSTDLALTLGGGISVAMRGNVSVEAEGRYIGLFGSRDFQVSRFGAGVVYRF